MSDDRSANHIVNYISCKDKLLAGHLSIRPTCEQFPRV